MARTLKLVNAKIWDGTSEDYLSANSVFVADGVIKDIGNALPAADEIIDLSGKALLPGFIDAHFHAYASEVNIPKVETLPLSYLAHHAGCLLKAALLRGFTTIRDAGGADWGLWRALEDSVLEGPRLFYAGRAISQTGGHGDSRDMSFDPCGCGHKAILSEVADGVDEVRKAARETLRRGAHQLKIFVSGGVSSPTDPIWMQQFSAEEIQAVVAEARSRRTYVMAHAYTAGAISHAVSNGVRSIEHGNLLDEGAANAMVEAGAFLVPTLVTYEALQQHGASLGLPATAFPKLREVSVSGENSIKLARKKGIPVGFGTDLLGMLHLHQLNEFKIRGKFETPLDVLRSATSVNAQLLNQEGLLGCIAPGALADMVAFEGDPLTDLGCVHTGAPALVVSRGKIVCLA